VYLIIFTITTIITLFLVYKDVNHPFATAMVRGYAIFLILSLLCFILAILWKAQSLSRQELQSRAGRFILYFIIFFGLSFLLNFDEPNLYKSISIAIGMSLGLSFFDLVLLSTKSEPSK